MTCTCPEPDESSPHSTSLRCISIFSSTPVFQVATVLHISPLKLCLHFHFPPYLPCPNLPYPWGCKEAQKTRTNFRKRRWHSTIDVCLHSDYKFYDILVCIESFVYNFNICFFFFLTLQLPIHVTINKCCVFLFLCQIPPWWLQRKAKTCRRLPVWLYIFLLGTVVQLLK